MHSASSLDLSCAARSTMMDCSFSGAWHVISGSGVSASMCLRTRYW